MESMFSPAPQVYDWAVFAILALYLARDGKPVYAMGVFEGPVRYLATGEFAELKCNHDFGYYEING